MQELLDNHPICFFSMPWIGSYSSSLLMYICGRLSCETRGFHCLFFCDINETQNLNEIWKMYNECFVFCGMFRENACEKPAKYDKSMTLPQLNLAGNCVKVTWMRRTPSLPTLIFTFWMSELVSYVWQCKGHFMIHCFVNQPFLQHLNMTLSFTKFVDSKGNLSSLK